MSIMLPSFILFFFFNDTATTEIYTLSLHDALPIYILFHLPRSRAGGAFPLPAAAVSLGRTRPDRKSTRLNSSHDQISYAVFCLKKKKKHRDFAHILYFILLLTTDDTVIRNSSSPSD